MSTDQSNIVLPQLMIGLEYLDLGDLIQCQVAPVDYLLPPVTSTLPSRRSFNDNKSLWAAILSERIPASMKVTLNGFYLFEWLPLSPGLSHTAQGEEATKMAMHFLISNPDVPGAVRAVDITRSTNVFDTTPPLKLQSEVSAQERVVRPLNELSAALMTIK